MTSGGKLHLGLTLIKLASAMLVGVAPAAAQHAAMTGSNSEVVSALPAQIDLVIAANDLAQMRAMPQGKALEAFLGESSDWSRTGQAWDQLSSKLRWTREEAIGALLGTHVVVAGTGSGGRASDVRFAVISTIKNETTMRVRERLDPVPRSLLANVPVFAVEGGAFQLAAVPGPVGARDWSRLVLSADRSLFEQMLTLSPGRAAAGTLAGTREWPKLKQLVDSDLFVLLREASFARGDFFALAAAPTRKGWTARFIATDRMVLAGFASTSSTMAPWPSEAVDALEQDATLLIAGSPRQQAAISGSPTLMTSLLNLMNLPEPVLGALDGSAIVALTLGNDQSSPDGSSLVLALPLNDIPAHANACDVWALGIAGVALDRVSESVTISEGVRSTRIADGTPALINTYFKSSGEVSWCYAAQPPENGVVTAGWMVMTIRLGSQGGTAASVRRLAHLLSHDEGRDRGTLFRLVVQPQSLVRMLEKAGIDRIATDGPSLKAMRWLDRVESRISRESAGMVEGSVSLDLNLKLLDGPGASVSAPATAGQQARPEQRQ